MSTEIKDTDFGFGPHALSQCGEGLVHFRATAPDGEFVQADMPRADFLDAIRTELNVIVIDKAELPEVTVANDDRFVEINGESYGIKGLRLSREFHEQEAREHLAILRWLDENPPIDPKFDALVELLEQHRDGTSTHLARILVDHGINPKDIS